MSLPKVATVVLIGDAEYLGLTRDHIDRQILLVFLDRVFSGIIAIFQDVDSFVELSHAAKGRSSTAEILDWQIDGTPRQTAVLQDANGWTISVAALVAAANRW